MTGETKKRKPRVRGRSDEAKKDRFIAQLEAGHSIRDACRGSGISAATAYEWRREDATFAKRWAEALEQAFDNIESVILKTANLAPTGLPGAATCAVFLAKARDPFRYCDRARAIRLQAIVDEERDRKALEAADAEAVERVMRALDQLAEQKRALPAPAR